MVNLIQVLDETSCKYFTTLRTQAQLRDTLLLAVHLKLLLLNILVVLFIVGNQMFFDRFIEVSLLKLVQPWAKQSLPILIID